MTFSKVELDFLASFAQEELEQDLEGPSHSILKEKQIHPNIMVALIEAWAIGEGKENAQDLIDRPVPFDVKWPWLDKEGFTQRKREAKSIIDTKLSREQGGNP